MIRLVDNQFRALVEASVAATRNGAQENLDVWIDTAFNGGLIVPREIIRRLGLKEASSTDAILADGQLVELQTFTCFLDWFGQTFRTQVVANDGQFALLGTILLQNRRLVIDYSTRFVSLE